MSYVVAVTARKGGVGKTTFAVSLASALALRGRTLLVDADDDQHDSYSASTCDPDPEVADIRKGRWGFECCWVTATHEMPSEVCGSIYKWVVIDGRPS